MYHLLEQKNCLQKKGKYSRCVAPVAVYVDTMRACSALTWRMTQQVGREQENNLSFLTRDIVGRCRALRTYLWRSGGSNYHFHFRRLVSVMTIFCDSTTFLNLQSSSTISGKIVSRYLTVSSRLSVNFFAASNPAAFGWL